MKTELILKIDKNIAESMRHYAVKNKKSMSKFVEDLFNNSMGINQRIEEISPLVKELSGIIREQDLENISYMSYLEKNMSKKIFVDSDVILDILCQREPYYEYAAYVFSLSDTRKIVLYTTSLVFSNVYYILRKLLGIQKAKEALRKLRLLVKVMPVEEKEVDLALNSKFSDFEDALQYYTAMRYGIEILLTRNIKDYKEREIIVQTPEEFIRDNKKIKV